MRSSARWYAALLLGAAACGSPPEAAPLEAGSHGSRVDETRASADVLTRAEQARGLAAAAVSGVRDRIEGVRAAQRGLDQQAAAVAAQVERVRGEAAEEGVAETESRAVALRGDLERLLEDHKALLAALRRVEGNIDAFENWVAEMYELALKGGGTDVATRTALEGLEEEAAELEHNERLLQYARESDDLVRRLGEVDGSLRALASGMAAAIGRRGPVMPVPVESVPEPLPPPPPDGEVVELVTNLGALVLDLYPDRAPRHVENFRRLARQGYYDGLTFHRIIPGFLAQGGCPLGDGSGGPGWNLDAEFNDQPHRRGTLSMARFAKPDSAGSQFFLCLDDLPELDGRYTVFGRLLRGSEVLAALEAVGTESGRPSQPVVIERVELRPRRPDDRVESSPSGADGA